jgi:predicted membrane-bound spermidine synthase
MRSMHIEGRPMVAIVLGAGLAKIVVEWSSFVSITPTQLADPRLMYPALAFACAEILIGAFVTVSTGALYGWIHARRRVPVLSEMALGGAIAGGCSNLVGTVFSILYGVIQMVAHSKAVTANGYDLSIYMGGLGVDLLGLIVSPFLGVVLGGMGGGAVGLLSEKARSYGRTG